VEISVRNVAIYHKRFLIAIGVTLFLATATVVWILSRRSVQVFDLPMKGAVLTPEWADNQHEEIANVMS